jgi:gamma-tubulin complex component 3
LFGTPRQPPALPDSEAQILRDLLFVFQGIDGQFIKWDQRSNMFVSTDSKLSPAIKSLILQIQEMGCNYRQVHSFVSSVGNKGLIQQSLVSALHSQLTEYYRIIAQFETQLPKDSSERLVGPEMPEALSLKGLFVAIQEPLEKLRFMKVLVEACERLGKAHGGALITLLYAYRDSGDPSVQQFAQALLVEAQKPLVNMLRRWLFEGELDDPFQEFFIQADESRGVDLWRSKYTLNQEMIPSFVPSTLADQILYIGKCLNFIRHVCREHDYVVSWSRRRETCLSSRPSQAQDVDPAGLTSVVAKAHKEISRHLLDIIFSRHKFVEHLGGIKRYLLTGQGDFIQYLMEIVGYVCLF